MVVILTICIPVTAVISILGTLKAVQLGLRWQLEAKEKEKEAPTMGSINPIAPVVEAVKKKIDRSVVEKAKAEEESLMREYLGTDDDPLNLNI